MMNLNYQMVQILLFIFFIIPAIHLYINRINNMLVFKIKDGYKLELQMSGTMKIFSSTKKLIDKKKKWRNVPNLEVGEEVLVQCNSINN